VIGAGFAIYAACVDFLLVLARAFGISYRDANALLFFVVWPVVTVALVAWAVVERVRLSRAQRSAPKPRSSA
jgi:hypothetical protein